MAPHLAAQLIKVVRHWQTADIRNSDNTTHPSGGQAFYSGSGELDNGGGADGQHTPTLAEVGVIVGVVLLVLVGISTVFLIRARKRKDGKDTEVTFSTADSPISTANNDIPSAGGNKAVGDCATRSSESNITSRLQDNPNHHDNGVGPSSSHN